MEAIETDTAGPTRDAIRDWDDVPGFRFLVAEQSGRALLRANGIPPMRRILMLCGPGTPWLDLACVLAGDLGLPLRALDMDRVSWLAESGRRARLVDTWERIGADRGVYVLDSVESLAGGSLAVLCGLLETQVASDSVVIGIAHGTVRECLSSRFEMVMDAR